MPHYVCDSCGRRMYCTPGPDVANRDRAKAALSVACTRRGCDGSPSYRAGVQ